MESNVLSDFIAYFENLNKEEQKQLVDKCIEDFNKLEDVQSLKGGIVVLGSIALVLYGNNMALKSVILDYQNISNEQMKLIEDLMKK